MLFKNNSPFRYDTSDSEMGSATAQSAIGFRVQHFYFLFVCLLVEDEFERNLFLINSNRLRPYVAELLER